MSRVLMTALLLVTVALLLACGGSGRPGKATEAKATPTIEGPPLDVGASAVAEDYQDNPIAADQKYLNRILRVAGFINGISRGEDGTPFILFDLAGSPAKSPLLTIRTVDDAAKIKPGMNVSLMGQCHGIKAGRVVIGPCDLVSAK